MTTVASKRKKYIREVKSTWWTKLDFYKAYILREATLVPTLWFCFVLYLGVSSNFDQGFISFLKNPLVVIFNLINIAGCFIHSKTFFAIAPKLMNVVVKEKNGDMVKQIDGGLVERALWIVTGVVSLIVLVLLYI